MITLKTVRNSLLGAAWLMLSASLAHGVYSTPYFTRKDAACMATNLYHEARGESYVGKLAVAKVTINRGNICREVFRPYQFSWTLKTKKLRKPTLEDVRVMMEAARMNFPATHYHATYVTPHWGKKLKYVTTIGNHKFYEKM